MPRSHFMINALEYLAQPHRSPHRAATEHERPRPASAAPTATGRSRGRAGRHPVLMIAIALLVAALVAPIAAKADSGPMSAAQRHASVTSMARAGDSAAAPSSDDWWLVALVGGGVLAVAVTRRAGLGRSAAVPRQDSAVAGAPLLAAARLVRDPKIRIESPLDDLAYLVLDQSPLYKPYPARAYWAAQAALDLRESRQL